jgi:hypothetical protein
VAEESRALATLPIGVAISYHVYKQTVTLGGVYTLNRCSGPEVQINFANNTDCRYDLIGNSALIAPPI